ncbi:hypothetical protein BDV93DRAFT_516775, partial [Ceratobasidium sp. AG-I]
PPVRLWPSGQHIPVGSAGDNDEPETFDLDETMDSTFHGLSKMSITPEDDDDADGGVFDMSQASGQLNLPPPEVPGRNSTQEAIPPSAPPALRSSPRKRATNDVPPPALNSNTASSTTAPPDVSVPTPRARRTPATPFSSASTLAAGAAIVWRGMPISPEELAAIQSAATQQAKCSVPARLSPMFKDLIDTLAVDPAYNPASEPDPLPEPPAPTRGRGSRGGRVGRGGVMDTDFNQVDMIWPI